MPPPDLDFLNQREFRKLVLSIQANTQRLDLLLAICDDRNLQDHLITACESELKEQGINPFRARLDLKQPSLRATLENLVSQNPGLRAGEPAVVTVLNANELLGVRLTDDKSEQERFFFSLQWTREALRQFEFPIVLWLTDAIATRLAQQAPDFWSWRSGVFEFAAQPQLLANLHQPLQPIYKVETPDEDSQLSIEELQRQITELQQSAPKSPLLVTLYNTLGKAYEQKYDYKQALELYEKSLALAKEKKDKAGQARSLCNLGDSLRYCGRPFQALEFYQQALSLYQELEERSGEMNALKNMGNSYQALGQYQRVIALHQQSLEIAREIGDRQTEAASLGNLGSAYNSLGQYQRAIALHQQSLEIDREIGDRHGEAADLGNLGNTYNSLGQYLQATDFLQQCLVITREIDDRQGEGNALGGLGNTYNSLGNYQQAIEFYQQQLAISRNIGDRHGEENALGNLGNVYDSLRQYRQAIEFYQQQLAIAREIGDRHGEGIALGNLGNAYDFLGQYRQAIEFYQQCLAIAREIGDRRSEGTALGGLGNALARVDQKWEAQSSYEAARALFKELGLQKKVEQCDTAIRDLGQKIVVMPKQAPAIGSEPPPIPDPIASSSPSANRQKRIPAVVWFLVGLGLVLLVSWLIR